MEVEDFDAAVATLREHNIPPIIGPMDLPTCQMVTVRDPDGHRTELLLPGIQIIDIDDEPVRCQVSPKANSNLWGLPAPRTWVEEATAFAGVEVRRPPVEGEPMTAEKYLAARLPEAVAG